MQTAPQSVAQAYDNLLRDRVIEQDANQLDIVRRLDEISEALRNARAGNGKFLGRLFGSRQNPEGIKGLYIWGSVGRGKTMLMDLFFESAPVAQKRRIHFHPFMAEVHAAIHTWRQSKKAGKARGEEPIGPVAEKLAAQTRLLCFDEFSVTDIADAMILGRLFTALFQHGVVVVATSNVEPGRLYENGLNRALFAPFIDTLLHHVDVARLDARTDFRLEKLSGAPVYYVPADTVAHAALDALFEKMTGKKSGAEIFLPVLGRQVRVPQAVGHVARFAFHDLCELPLAAADYLAIAERFHTVFIDAIPALESHQRNEAKRFINLIDTLYDENVKVIASAAAEPHELYRATEGKEVFEFERTSSRLIEMRSFDYLALPHGKSEALSPASMPGIVET